VKRVVLISCVSEKLQTRAPAQDLYVSSLFRLALSYARQLRPDSIFILSAKYGLLRPEQEIDPYNVTLNKMPSRQVKEWAERVLKQLEHEADLRTDHFIFLAGERYRKHLMSRIDRYEVPMAGLRIGEQLQYLSRRVDGRG
jgi:cytoplasmic iron level regulating protein YaaA (DUF328/UPF0246 family)